MLYTVAVFFHDQQSLNQAFLLYATEDELLDFPLLRDADGNYLGKLRQNCRHPGILLKITEFHRHPLPRGSESLIQELYVVEMGYEEAFDILSQEDGRNKLRRRARHFFLKLGHIPPKRNVLSITKRDAAA